MILFFISIPACNNFITGKKKKFNLSREPTRLICFHNPQGLWPQDVTPHPRQDPSELPGLQSWAEDAGPGLLCFCPARAEGEVGTVGWGLQRVGLEEAACNRRVSASQLMGRHGEGASTAKRTAALHVQGSTPNCRSRCSLPRWQQCSPRCSPPSCTSRCPRSAHSTGYTWHAREGPLCTTSPSGDLLPLGLLEKSQGSKRSPQMGEGFQVAAQPGSSWQRQSWRVSRPCHHLLPHITSRRNGQLGSQTEQWRQSKPSPDLPTQTSPPQGKPLPAPAQLRAFWVFYSQDRDLPSREHPPVGS